MSQELQYRIKQALTDLSFRKSTLDQLEKDFQRCGLKLSSLDVHQLLNSIETCIQSLSSVQLQQLIYLIDIPETIFTNISSLDHFHAELSEAILMREALKVYLRSEFN